MEAIINFFTAVGDFFGSIIDFLRDGIQSMISLFKLLGQASVKVPRIFTVLPPGVTAVLVAAIAIAVLYKVLGREG